MVPTRKEITAFVRRTRKYLDTKVYGALSQEGRSFTRISNKDYKKNNNFVNVIGKSFDGREFKIWEKCSTVLSDCYVELFHIDKRNVKVPSMLLRTKADVLAYTHYNERTNTFSTKFLNVTAIKNRALKALQDNSNDIIIKSGNGAFKVTTYKFDIDKLDDICFVTFNKELA